MYKLICYCALSICILLGFAALSTNLRKALFNANLNYPSPADDYIEDRLDLNELLVNNKGIFLNATVGRNIAWCDPKSHGARMGHPVCGKAQSESGKTKSMRVAG